jgi:hypothetical protein
MAHPHHRPAFFARLDALDPAQWIGTALLSCDVNPSQALGFPNRRTRKRTASRTLNPVVLTAIASATETSQRCEARLAGDRVPLTVQPLLWSTRITHG